MHKILFLILVFSYTVFAQPASITADVCYNKEFTFSPTELKQFLSKYWGLQTSNIKGDAKSFKCKIDGFSLEFNQKTKPNASLKLAARQTYLWPNALAEMSKSKQVYTVKIATNQDYLKAQITLTKVLYMLNQTNLAIGVHVNGMLLQKQFYENEAKVLQKKVLPLRNWIFIETKTKDNRRFAYTNGLINFGLKDIEISSSSKNMEIVLAFLYNLTSYSIEKNIKLIEGETIRPDKENAYQVHEGKGTFSSNEYVLIDI